MPRLSDLYDDEQSDEDKADAEFIKATEKDYS